MLRRFCEFLDGPDGVLGCIAILVAFALFVVVLDTYGRMHARPRRRR
jgi:hypothetical protein